MKSLIVYYSKGNNNKNLSEIISKKLNCPYEEISEKKKRNFFTFLPEIFFKKPPEINNISNNLKDYDHIVIASPIWGGKPASPMISFIKEYKKQIKKYSFITLSGGPNKKAIDFLEEKLEIKPVAFCDLSIIDIIPDKYKNKPIKIMKYKASKEEINEKCKAKIDDFISSIK